MENKIKLAAICGSTREKSSNLSLIRAFAELGKVEYTVSVFTHLSEIPPFNPDHDNEDVPIIVNSFRKQIREADAVLICTPEYAMGVPGALKNAIDWTVSSMEFSKKPVALITASLAGEKGHTSLLGTLQIIEAEITQNTQLLISSIKTKISEEGVITDSETLNKITHLLKSLETVVRNNI